MKFMIMMQLCEDESKWEFDEIRKHQDKMLSILMRGTSVNDNLDISPSLKDGFSKEIYIE